MTTRDEILHLGEKLIRLKGYNAFSYHDISAALDIKNAAVHYHFPKKTDLAVAILQGCHERSVKLLEKHKYDSAIDKLKAFLKVYADSYKHSMVCLVGGMAAEFHSFEAPVQKELKQVVEYITDRLAVILEEGKKEKVFQFTEAPRTKALMIITNMIAALQLERIMGKKEFTDIYQAVINEVSA